MVGGFGDCGRALCCSNWLKDFRQITVKMAKDQNLALNPNKITGVCGRLKCCLSYELEFYQEAKDRYPRVGAQCESKTYGAGVVKDYNPLRGSVVMAVSDKLVEVPLDDLEPGFQTASKKKTGSRPQKAEPEKQPGGNANAAAQEESLTTDAAEEESE
jgi:cell fate regulator YaaT (PSP1 superfamily)